MYNYTMGLFNGVTDLGSLTNVQIQNAPAADFAVLTGAQVATLTASQATALTAEKIQQIPTAAKGKLTAGVVANLTGTQLAGLLPANIPTLNATAVASAIDPARSMFAFGNITVDGVSIPIGANDSGLVALNTGSIDSAVAPTKAIAVAATLPLAAALSDIATGLHIAAAATANATAIQMNVDKTGATGLQANVPATVTMQIASVTSGNKVVAASDGTASVSMNATSVANGNLAAVGASGNYLKALVTNASGAPITGLALPVTITSSNLVGLTAISIKEITTGAVTTATKAASANNVTVNLPITSDYYWSGGGGGAGDPYVTTFSNISYKLPTVNAAVRYFQKMESGKLLTVNAQLKTVEREEMSDDTFRSLLVLKNKVSAKQFAVLAAKLAKPETLCFFERISVQHGDQRLVVNLWNSRFELVENTLRCEIEKVNRPDLLRAAGGIYSGYKGETLRLTLGGTAIYLSVFDSPMVRNGISIETGSIKGANGVIVNALSEKAMTLSSLASIEPVATRDSLRAVSQVETFIDHEGVRSRNIITYK